MFDPCIPSKSFISAKAKTEVPFTPVTGLYGVPVPGDIVGLL